MILERPHVGWFTRSAAPLLLLLLLVLCADGDASDPEETVARPNVLILFTDDQRFNTIHTLGNEVVRTPNMDRLVQSGVTFTRAHIMGAMHGAVCAPSRAMLLTGRPLFDLFETGDIIPAEHTMMPEAFALAGYATFGTGKWHNGKNAYARAFREGDNIFFGGMHQPEAGGHEAPWLFHFDSAGLYPNDARWQGGPFSSKLFADAAIGFIESRRANVQPFFAWVSFTSPHDPRTPPMPWAGWYSPAAIPLPANFMAEHPFDNGELRIRDEMLLPHPRTPDAVRQEIASYYGMISEVDAQIGRILDALDENGLRDKTLIVFAGDNGLALGSHGLLGKQNLYDHSVRVPLIVAGPGIPRDETRDALVYLFDVFPTLVEQIGLSAPETLEGRSLTAVLRNAEAPSREAVYYAYRDLQRGVRTADNWKLIRYNVNGIVETQLFDLNADPDELRSLADDPAHAADLERLEDLLLQQSVLYHDPLGLADAMWVRWPAEADPRQRFQP